MTHLEIEDTHTHQHKCSPKNKNKKKEPAIIYNHIGIEREKVKTNHTHIQPQRTRNSKTTDALRSVAIKSVTYLHRSRSSPRFSANIYIYIYRAAPQRALYSSSRDIYRREKETIPLYCNASTISGDSRFR